MYRTFILTRVLSKVATLFPNLSAHARFIRFSHVTSSPNLSSRVSKQRAHVSRQRRRIDTRWSTFSFRVPRPGERATERAGEGIERERERDRLEAVSDFLRGRRNCKYLAWHEFQKLEIIVAITVLFCWGARAS